MDNKKDRKDGHNNRSLGINKKKEVNYDKPLGENIRFKENTRRQIISVFASQSDTTHPKVLELAKESGYIQEERYESLISPPTGVKPELEPDELAQVLENYFGFYKGIVEIHECHGIQKTRFGDKRAGELRYCGEERTDKDWLESGMASQEVKDFSKYGGEVLMTDNKGYGNLVINDFLGE